MQLARSADDRVGCRLAGKKIANVVRIVTVFWASCAPVLMATIAPHQADPSLPIGPAFLVGIAGAFYAGGVGAFAALKKRKLGVGIQGMAVGSAGSVFVESFAMGYINNALAPETVEYLLPWIQLALRCSCGGVVVKLFLRFQDARDMGSTVVSGAVAALQVFCSFGFSFTQSLELGAIMSGDFGCTDWGCYLTLFVFVIFMAVGAMAQLKQFAVEKAQEAGTFEPKSKADKLSAFMNDKLKIIMEVNQTLLDASESHTPEELAELAKKHMLLVMQCAQVFSYAICTMSGMAVAMEMVELLFTSGIPHGFLSWVIVLVTLCGVLTTLAGVYGFRSFRLPKDAGKLKSDLMERGLYLCVLVVPLAIILMIVFATTIHSDFVRAYLDIEGLENNLEGLPGAEEIEVDIAGLPLYAGSASLNLTDAEVANMTALEDRILEAETVTLSDILELLTISLTYLVLSLAFAIYTMSKALGGWLYIAIRISSFTAYIVLIYGVLIATAGYHFDSAEYMASVNDARKGNIVVNPYTMLGAVGLFMVFQSLVGLLGLKIGKHGKYLVKFYTLTLYITLLANILTLLLGASLALQTESSGNFVLVRDDDFDPPACYPIPAEMHMDVNGDGVVTTEPAECPEEFRGESLSDKSNDAARAVCEDVEGCTFKVSGRLHGKFGHGMNKDEMVELIRESWRVLLIIGVVICAILLTAVKGSRYVGRHVGEGAGLQTAEEALETSKAEAIEADTDKAKKMVADAHKTTCPTCGGSGCVQDEETEQVLEEVDAALDKAEDEELEQAGVDVEKRTEIKLSKKEQKKADAAAKKAAAAEAKAEKARLKEEKKAAKKAQKAEKKNGGAPPPVPSDGDAAAPPAAADEDGGGGDTGDAPAPEPPPAVDVELADLEDLQLDDLENPMMLGGESDPAAAAAAIAAAAAGAGAGDDEFEMEATNMTTLGEEKPPMTKKEKKAAEKAAKKAEKEAKKAEKKKGKDKGKDKVMETEFDSPRVAADETAENPLADAALEYDTTLRAPHPTPRLLPLRSSPFLSSPLLSSTASLTRHRRPAACLQRFVRTLARTRVAPRHSTVQYCTVLYSTVQSRASSRSLTSGVAVNDCCFVLPAVSLPIWLIWTYLRTTSLASRTIWVTYGRRMPRLRSAETAVRWLIPGASIARHASTAMTTGSVNPARWARRSKL